MDWDKLDDSKIASIIQKKMKSEVESYTMLSENGKSNNKKSLAEFNSSKSKKKKFMFVMDMLNEGVHVEDVDGIIWLRPLGKNSRIIFMQQLGRCITAVGKENKDRIPQIIDLVNNTLKVSLENSEENLKEDLQLIKNINIWIEKNKRTPIYSSSDIEEQANYNYLKILKKKYSKYLSEDLLEKQPVRKKLIIREIIKIGSNFDLWNYEFISKDNSNNTQENSKSERKDLLSVLKIEGILRKFSDLYNKVEELTPKLSDEEQLFEYLQAMKDNNNKIISQRDKTKKFSNGKYMGYYWSDSKDKIYKMIAEEDNLFIVQYKEQCEELIKAYDKYQNYKANSLEPEEKLFEYLQAMKENDNKIIPYKSSLLFSNKQKMKSYWFSSRNKDKIYRMIAKEGNPFVIRYKAQCETLIKDYKNNKDKEKLFEYLQAIKENNNQIIPKKSTLKFSDGKKIKHFWYNNKDEIYRMITEEGNFFIEQYKAQCEVLIKAYDKCQKDKANSLEPEEKLFEYLQAIKDNNNQIITNRDKTKKFSNGELIGSFWNSSSNKDKAYKMIIEEGNSFVIRYKAQCEVLIKAYDKYQNDKANSLEPEEKLFEYLQAMKENGNKIIPQSSQLLFSNGSHMNHCWSSSKSKDKIYKMITEEDNQFIEKYKEQCEELIKEYNKKSLGDEEKLFEYLQAMKENDNKTISSRSSLDFSDGSHMNQYWRNNKDKIYKMITEEGNMFVAQYKDQCEVLIKEYIEVQEKKKKKQEKYKKSESDFREDSSFDKTLKNEKGKYSNEGEKVL